MAKLAGFYFSDEHDDVGVVSQVGLSKAGEEGSGDRALR